MPEQITEEDLKNMSPEEIEELQRKNCVFCHIINGRVPSKKIYEDENTLAILDIYPATAGHILLLPKEHYSIMPKVPDPIIEHMGMVAKALSLALIKGLGAKSTNIFIANGAVAGQKAAHFIIHVIPRKENDGLDFNLPENKVSEMQLEKVRETIIKKLAELMKKKEQELVRDYKEGEGKAADTGAEETEEKKKKESEEEKAEEAGEKEEEAKKTAEKKSEKESKEKKQKEEKKKTAKESEEDDEATLDDIANLFSQT